MNPGSPERELGKAGHDPLCTNTVDRMPHAASARGPPVRHARQLGKGRLLTGDSRIFCAFASGCGISAVVTEGALSSLSPVPIPLSELASVSKERRRANAAGGGHAAAFVSWDDARPVPELALGAPKQALGSIGTWRFFYTTRVLSAA